MNREILFRGKCLSTGLWVYGYYQSIHSRDYIKSGESNTRFGCGIEVDPATVGQSTGLLDKNGKRIFEGDVLEQKYTIKRKSDGKILNNGHRKSVEFGEYEHCDYGNVSSFTWMLGDSPICRSDINERKYDNPYWDLIEGDLIYRVIGNIHDSPELIK